MVSRDTKVQLGTVVLTLLVLLGAQYVGVLPDGGPALGVVVLVSYGVIFGGSHLYLALRGEDGMVSVRLRWRYVATLAVVLLSGIMSVLGDGVIIGPISVRTAALVVAGIVAVAYVVVESIDAYRSFDLYDL